MTRKRTGPGKTKLHLSFTATNRKIVRTLQVLSTFDRIGVSLLCELPFGTVSRLFSELENEGYIQRANGQSRGYDQAELRQNPDLQNVRLNYGGAASPKSIVMKKSKRWAFFMARWRDGLLKKLGHATP